jgi:hypothetical protein
VDHVRKLPGSRLEHDDPGPRRDPARFAVRGSRVG